MNSHKRFTVLVITVLLSISLREIVNHGQSSQISQGINYLKSTQNADGSWGNTSSSLNHTFPTTTTVLEALRAIETSPSTNQTNAIQFLNTQTVDVNPFLAARLKAVSGASNTTNDLTALLAGQNADGGWGTAGIFQSDPLDTSLVLLALKAGGVTDERVLITALTYVVWAQNTDGGWPLTQGEDSQIFYTAYALQALNAYRSQYPSLVSLSDARALAYLHGRQNADGGYGSPLSTPFETALTLQAINGLGVQTPAETNAVNYLNSTQLANGSWSDDAYSTALALRALTAQVAGPPNQMPVITSQPVTTAREGQLYSYQVQAADPDNDPLTFALLRAPSGMTITPTGLIQWTPAATQAGSAVVIIKVSDNKGGFTLQQFTLNVLALGVDLTPSSVDISAVTTDTATLVIGGTVNVQIQNKGGSLFGGSFAVLLFADSNGNGTYQPGIDSLLGTNRYSGSIDSNTTSPIDVLVSGVVQFRDNLIYAFVDSSNEVPELNETNNIAGSGLDSKHQPPVGDFQPKVKWEYASPRAGVYSPPVVAPLIDTNGDGTVNERDIPAVIAVDFDFSGGPARLVALRGDTGATIFSTEAPFSGYGTAVGNIDGIGPPEVCAPDGNRVRCFHSDGTLSWTSPNLTRADSITLADLDGDGKSEILCGSGALNFNGTLRWDNFNRLPGYFGGMSATRARQVADLDLDGLPEIISGASALDRNGDAIWYWSSFSNGDGTWTSRGTLDRGATTVSFVSNFSLNDGFTALANLDNDPNPEIVFINDSAIDDSMWIFEHDGRLKTGRPIRLYEQIPGQVSFTMGAPTVADFDGDGQPEIAVPAKQQLFSFPTPDNPQRAMMAVYRLDGSLMWRRNLISSGGPANGIYPASAFDFDGDGAAELVYQDTQRLYILNGRDGTSLFEFAVNRVQDGEATRYPTIADVDNDGSADIVVPTSQSFIASAASRSGLLVLSDIKGNWRNSRRTWNQWHYHVTNVNEDGLIPRVAANNWQGLNTHRAQTSIEGLDRLAAPDLTVSRVTINTQSCPASLSITARIGNGGALHAGAGVKVNFYSGDSASGGVIIGTMQTTRALYPGEFEDVTLAGVAPPSQQVFVTVNDPPATTLTPSANLSRLPHAWAQSSGFFVRSFVPVNNQAYLGIDGNTSGGWSENFAGGAVSTGPSYYEVRFPFPVNFTAVTLQNAGANNTGFLAGTLSFSNGFTAPATLNANGEGTTSFPEQQNINWVRLTASSIMTGGASVSEFIVGGSYAEPPFRLNEGEGRGNNNKASAAAVTTPCDLNANQPPQITSAPPTSAQIGIAYSYQVQAVDANNDPLSYALALAPAGMTIGATGLINWTPASSQDGDSAVTVTVSDGRGGIAQQSCTIRVPAPATPNRPPQISSPSPVAVIMGQTLQYDVIALDPDGDTIVFTLLQSPAGATIDQFAGRILWSPNGTQAAPQYFFVEAQDGKGGRATQSFFVAVSAPPDELPPGTLPPGTIGCSIATDKRSYSSNSVAQILASLQNHSATLSAANLQAQITVTNPNGQSIFTSPLSVNTLFPLAFFKGGSTFATATRSPGVYRTTLDVRYGQQQVCTSQASFDILSSAAQGTALAGAINVTPAIIEKPAGAAFTYQVSNIGNVDLAALEVRILVVDPAGNVIQTLTDQTSLNLGQSASNRKEFNSAGVAPGEYVVILQGQIGGTAQTIGSAPLRINSSTFHLDSAGYRVDEGCGVATIIVTRTGDTSTAITVDYLTSNANASQRSDYTLASGTLAFGPGETSKSFSVLTSEDGYVEGNETLTVSLSNATNGGGVGVDGSATVTIADNDVAPATLNPIDDAGTFVCQHYHDFLAREADAGGAAYWTSQLAQCGTDPVCIRNKRIDVSNAFFFEQEFQETGAYVYRIYKAAMGQRPSYAQFMPDRGRVIGGPQLDQSKTDFANAFVQRAAFLAVYANSMTPAQFVDGLNANTGGSLTQAQRDALVAGLANETETRGSVLRKVADNSAFIDREYNASFVLTQYFGYLRRDLDQGGFDFWLAQVNRFPVRDVAIQHAMVCSFITSAEYQERFGAVVSHSNQECPQ